VTEALAEVPTISPAEASQMMKSNPDTLVIDVRDAADIAATGMIPGAVNISLGTLTFKADNQVPPEWRDANLANRSRQIITVCYSGEMGALAAKLLKDMGFTNVSALKGGTVAWKAAGYPTTEAPKPTTVASPKTFPQMVTEALAEVPTISPAEASQMMKSNPDTNRSRQIITTCYSGEMGALAGKLLKDMGFTNVSALKGGTVAWKAAGYPTK